MLEVIFIILVFAGVLGFHIYIAINFENIIRKQVDNSISPNKQHKVHEGNDVWGGYGL